MPPIKKSIQQFQPWFQQDGHPAHSSTIARTWLDEAFPDRWIGLYGPVEWPPRSPDLTPLDYFLWGYLKSVVYNNRPETVDQLKNEIVRHCRAIEANVLQNVMNGFVARIGHCIAAEGRQFEHLVR
jgi:hypothetical protein